MTTTTITADSKTHLVLVPLFDTNRNQDPEGNEQVMGYVKVEDMAEHNMFTRAYFTSDQVDTQDVRGIGSTEKAIIDSKWTLVRMVKGGWTTPVNDDGSETIEIVVDDSWMYKPQA